MPKSPAWKTDAQTIKDYYDYYTFKVEQDYRLPFKAGI